MAQPTYRSWVGVAKGGIEANLTSNLTASATALLITNTVGTTGTLTTSGASYSAIIIDGVNTEVVACSGNLSAGSIACGATTNAHLANIYVIFQLTASIGPTAYVPVVDIDFGDDIAQLPDENIRGSNVKTFDIIQGLRKSAIVLGGSIFADTFGYVLSSFFGAYDYSATGGGNPTTYAFSPLNTGSTQPTNYHWYDYNPGNSNTRIFAGTKVEQLQIKVDPGALATWTANIQGFSSGVVANPGTIPPAYSSVMAIPSRVGLLTIGGTATAKLLAFEATLKRDQFEMIPTVQGIQDYLQSFAGPAQVTGKFTVVVDDDVQLLNYLNRSQPALALTLNQGATTAVNGVKLQMTKTNYDNPTKVLQKGKAFVVLEVPFTAVANSTDKSTAGAGLSPALVTLSTGTTTGATLY